MYFCPRERFKPRHTTNLRESISLPPLLQRGGLRERKIAQHFEVKSSEFRVYTNALNSNETTGARG